MMIHGALYAETRTITLKPRRGCPVCGGQDSVQGAVMEKGAAASVI
jgi:hypothetical protein